MDKIGRALKVVFEALKQNGDVGSQKEFAEKLHTYSHALNEMYKGKRPVTIKVLEQIHNTFNANVNFLLSGGQGEMFRNDRKDLLTSFQAEDQVTLTILRHEVAHIRKELVSKDKIISLLEDRLRELQTKLNVV